MSAITSAQAETRSLSPSKGPTRRAKRTAKPLAWIGEHIVLVTLAILFVAPVVFVFLTSVMTSNQTLTPSIWPTPWTWGNYIDAFRTVPLLQWFGNSAFYAISSTLLMLLSSVPAAYVLARIRFRGATVIFVAIIVTMLLPPSPPFRCT